MSTVQVAAVSVVKFSRSARPMPANSFRASDSGMAQRQWKRNARRFSPQAAPASAISRSRHLIYFCTRSRCRATTFLHPQ